MKMADLMREYFDEQDTSESLLTEDKLPVRTKPGMDWEIIPTPNRLVKKFKFKKRKHLYNFVQDVLRHEDEKQHHASIKIQYKTVTIEVWTHDLKDITGMDKEFARTVNEIYEDSNVNLDE
tara:strand:+ start:37 stop:399 length:363 start_codon:yes stop_codon:yes gene_type:complete